MSRRRNRNQNNNQAQQGSASVREMPGLILDFSNTNRKWQRRWGATLRATSELENALDVIEIDVELDRELGIELPPSEAEQLAQERKKLDILEERIDKMILEVLVEAPRDILKTDAPDDIDWSVATNLDYIRGDKWGDFLIGITVASSGGARANF